MWYRAPNLETAVALAERMKASGQAIWFRGQTRTWPMLSSFVRKKPDEQNAAIERFGIFWSWVQSIPALAEIARNKDMVLAVAQHYGFATNLVDFSTEPRVAAFFSAHEAKPPEDGEEDLSCIICLDYAELKDIYEYVKIVRPNMPEPRAIAVDIPELWRIQAQHGVFLEYPFDAGFERYTFGFDRIVFPTERNPKILTKLIPVEDIYPTQKSDLEVLLDQYVMLEKMAEGSKVMNQLARDGKIATHRVPLNPDGIEAECFGSTGLPVHASWGDSRLVDWLRPAKEAWAPISAAPTVSILYPNDGGCSKKLNVMQKQITETLASNSTHRTGPVKWTLTGVSSDDAARIVRAMDLVWDGLRRWPYDLGEISQALATVIEYGVLVAQNPEARTSPKLAKELAEECLGDAIEVEIAMEDGSYTRGYANKQSLLATVRDDFFSFLTDEWRPQITDIRHILQIAFNPTRSLVFDRLKAVFCTQIVPTQVVLRDEASGKARLHNLARATRLGLP